MAFVESERASESRVVLVPVLRDEDGRPSHVGWWPAGPGRGFRLPSVTEHSIAAAARAGVGLAKDLGSRGDTLSPGPVGTDGPVLSYLVDAASDAPGLRWTALHDLPVLTPTPAIDDLRIVGYLLERDARRRRSANPVAEAVRDVYAVSADRAVSHSGLMWQTPALALTAQAFLLALALAADTRPVVRAAAALAAIVLAVLSAQLMAKHSHHEMHDRLLLERIEVLASWPAVHSKPTPPDTWFVAQPSRTLWRRGLVFFAALAGAVVVVVLLDLSAGTTILDRP